MQLSEFIDIAATRTNLSVRNKRQLLQSLGQAAAQKLGVDAAAIAESISERERLGSTGFGGGVAIPHGKIEGLEKVFGLVARLEEPIDYGAIDKMPIDIVFLLLSPPEAGADHLRALAAISRVIRHGETIEKMRGARNRDALAAVLLGNDEPCHA